MQDFEEYAQQVTDGLDLSDAMKERIKQEMENLNEIDNIHNMHVWSLNEKQIYLECHVDICRDLRLSQLETVKAEIHRVLSDEFSIDHITLQCEYKSCKTRNILDS